MKNIVLLFTLLAFSALLQGCLAVGAAAGVTASAAVYNERSFRAMKEDALISAKIKKEIDAYPAAHKDSHIGIATFKNMVLLTGQVPSNSIRQQVVKFARHVPKVRRVIDEISIGPPTSELTRIGDTWITTKIKAEMIATKGIHAGQIKVVTEDGVVYLMGIIDQKQATRATELSRQVSGVKKVVKIFEYEKIEDA